LHDPEVLILDEPTSGLDPNQIVEIRELITAIGKEKTVLLSTHIMQEVQALCSRVIIIARGKLVADSPIEALKAQGGGSALVVSFEGAVEEKSLRGLKNLRRLEPAGSNRWKLHTATPDALRRELMQWAITNDVAIASIGAETQSLEEVFRSLTGGEQATSDGKNKNR
jgi:ABC-2 type transport system ATP-binding protein